MHDVVDFLRPSAGRIDAADLFGSPKRSANNGNIVFEGCLLRGTTIEAGVVEEEEEE